MTLADFKARYRGRMLLFLTEAWSVRKLEPSALGLVLDAHTQQLDRLLDQMHKDLSPEPKPQAAPVNGAVRK